MDPMSELDPTLPLPPCQAAVARSAPGEARDTAEWTRGLVAQHYDFLWRSLRRLGAPDGSIEDAAQQVLLVAARRRADIREGAERGFLFGAAIRVASDMRRAARRRPEDARGDGDDFVVEPGPTTDDLIDDRTARRLLDAALESMTFDLRTVFILSELEEMTMAEIATMLEVPPGTVASRLRRAREAFERIVARMQAARDGAQRSSGGDR